MSTTNHYVTTKQCCSGWGPVKKLNGVIEFGSARQIYYHERPFLFCPWCGQKIVTERGDARNYRLTRADPN